MATLVLLSYVLPGTGNTQGLSAFIPPRPLKSTNVSRTDIINGVNKTGTGLFILPVIVTSCILKHNNGTIKL